MAFVVDPVFFDEAHAVKKIAELFGIEIGNYYWSRSADLPTLDAHALAT
jgi:hypothetical protein